MVQIGHYSMGVQGFGQLLQLGPARYANGKMVQADTPLAKAIIGRGSGQRRAEHQAIMATDPQPNLLAGKVLVHSETENSFVERTGAGEVSDVEGDVVESGRHENHATGACARGSATARGRQPGPSSAAGARFDGYRPASQHAAVSPDRAS